MMRRLWRVWCAIAGHKADMPYKGNAMVWHCRRCHRWWNLRSLIPSEAKRGSEPEHDFLGR